MCLEVADGSGSRECHIAVQLNPPRCRLSFVARPRAAGIVADWRRPNVLRLAPVFRYNPFRHVDAAVEVLRRTLNA